MQIDVFKRASTLEGGLNTLRVIYNFLRNHWASNYRTMDNPGWRCALNTGLRRNGRSTMNANPLRTRLWTNSIFQTVGMRNIEIAMCRDRMQRPEKKFLWIAMESGPVSGNNQ